jgi:16S rRNA (cytosine1402-N4)-methyltransferase
MMALGDKTDDLAAGGPERHVPVLLNEVLEWLDPQPGEVMVDGTFGAGGYSRKLLERDAQRWSGLTVTPMQLPVVRNSSPSPMAG